MPILLKDGTKLTIEQQQSATLLFFETKNGNIIVINDSLMNLQNIIVTKDDFGRIKALHEVGGELVELLQTPELLSGEFDDTAAPFALFPEFEKIVDLFDKKHVGTVVYKGKDISFSYTVISVPGENKTAILNNSALTAEIIDSEEDNDLYRIKIQIPGMDEVNDILKAISIDVGPIRETMNNGDTEETEEPDKA